MKPPTRPALLAAALLLPLLAQAQQLKFSFETGAGSWDGTANWAATGPATDGLASVKTNAVVGGWTLGSHSMNFGFSDFDNNSVNDNVTLAAIGASGQGTVSFDIIIDNTTSFPVAGDTWYSINFSANSTGGWTQFNDIAVGQPGFGWHPDGSTGVISATFSYTFAQLNWTNVGVNWYQLNFGSNSETSRPVNFYVDNVVISGVTAVPEPATYAALAGLAVLASVALRRRR